MSNLIGEPSADASRRPWLARRTRAATMVAFTGIAAVISYSDGLDLIRYAGASGPVAYLYPLLPDGLILISSVRLYEAAPKRPGWAMTGVIIGVTLTLAMNVGAGILHNWMYALADGVVPVVFFVALEVLRGAVSGRQAAAAGVPAAVDPGPARPEPEPAEPLTPERAFVALVDSGSRQEIADLLGWSKSKVNRVYWKLTRTVQDGPEEAPAEAAGEEEAGVPEPPEIRYTEPAAPRFQPVPRLRRLNDDLHDGLNGGGPHE